MMSGLVRVDLLISNILIERNRNKSKRGMDIMFN